uniref:Uncharacterized protein n=1 Tax=Cacopsylla melanoneura TaxID=428564 RepID=A0A8D9BKG7_9HEMI
MPFLLVLMQNKSYYVLCAYWVNKVTNQELLRRMGKEQKVIETIKSRKLQFFGHMLRGDKYELLHLILQGKICGKKGRGRPRMSWLHNLKEWFGYNTGQLFNAARNRHHIAVMVPKLDSYKQIIRSLHLLTDPWKKLMSRIHVKIPIRKKMTSR